MYKAHRIVIFLVVALGIFTAPLLINHGQAAAQMSSDLNTPEIEALSEQACIESTEYMRAEHMHLLDEWRNEVIREGNTEYTATSGEVYTMSLEKTCFSCHSNRAEFCLSCHDSLAVETDCWNCHDGGNTGGAS